MKSSELPILHYIIQRSGKQYNKKTACRDLWPTSKVNGPVSICELFNWHAYHNVQLVDVTFEYNFIAMCNTCLHGFTKVKSHHNSFVIWKKEIILVKLYEE
jgi:hypothetical protein